MSRPPGAVANGVLCPVCGQALPPPSLRVPSVVVDTAVLQPNRAAALRAPRGDLVLARCTTCGLVRNVAFDPDLVSYSSGYDASQWASPTFRRFAANLARSLVERHGLAGATVLEIGCGSGELLVLLRQAGVAVAVGIDPSFPPAAAAALPGGVTVLAEPFGPGHASLAGDAVVCRQTLEHLPDPVALVRTLRQGFPSGARLLYVDVPDAAAVFAGPSTWDVVYQHVNYFERAALVRLLEAGGFDVQSVGTSYGGQFLFAEAAPRAGSSGAAGMAGASGTAGGAAGTGASGTAGGAAGTGASGTAGGAAGTAGGGAPSPDAVESWRAVAAIDPGDLQRKIDRARGLLGTMKAAGRNIALWGAGSRGVTFLDLVDRSGAVGSVVDVNSSKQGRYVPGSGHRILDPVELRTVDPDVVLLVNAIYRNEVAASLRDLGLRADLRVV